GARAQGSRARGGTRTAPRRRRPGPVPARSRARGREGKSSRAHLLYPKRSMQKVGPRHRMCRRVGAPVCGRPNCPSNKRPYPPGLHGRGRKRLTEYQMRLVEKQKLRAIYGVGERQFRSYFARAERKVGVTGEELLRQLETRA